MRWKISVTLLALALLLSGSAGAGGPVTPVAVGNIRLPSKLNDKAWMTDQLIRRHDFMGIFRERHVVGIRNLYSDYDLDAPVRAYIADCCDTPAEVYTLLLQGGFKLGSNVVGTEDYAGQGYDEVYVARRRAYETGLPDIFAYRVYEVTVFIRDAAVADTGARSFVVHNNAVQRPQ